MARQAKHSPCKLESQSPEPQDQHQLHADVFPACNPSVCRGETGDPWNTQVSQMSRSGQAAMFKSKTLPHFLGRHLTSIAGIHTYTLTHRHTCALTHETFRVWILTKDRIWKNKNSDFQVGKCDRCHAQQETTAISLVTCLAG